MNARRLAVAALVTVAAVAGAEAASVAPKAYEQHAVIWSSGPVLDGSKQRTVDGECSMKIVFPTRETLRGTQRYFNIRMERGKVGNTVITTWRISYSKGYEVTPAPEGSEEPFTWRRVEPSADSGLVKSGFQYSRGRDADGAPKVEWSYRRPRVPITLDIYKVREFPNGGVETDGPSTGSGWKYCDVWFEERLKGRTIQRAWPFPSARGSIVSKRVFTMESIEKIRDGKPYRDGREQANWDVRALVSK